MLKCTGICSQCGKCKNSAMMQGANNRKTRMISYPPDFEVDKSGVGYGIAFDLGTTTVVGLLWDLKKGTQVDICAKTNPQNEFGMDVISRINFCGGGDQNLRLLRKKIITCLNEIIEELCENACIYSNKILKVAVCGNTTMAHIFAGHSPKSLAKAPFLPQYEGSLVLTSKESMLDINENGEVIVVQNIAGHVGGDITAGIIATRLLEKNNLTLFIDIGTNGEIVLTDGLRTLTCSTAAGPAFEGAGIKHGMRAANGAIEKVRVSNETFLIKTIGNKEPQGICGSGLIDIIAALLDTEKMNKKGLINKDLNGIRQVLIAEKEDGTGIYITQNDIREVQLAKGAISAGISIMLKTLGKTENDIDKVLVAGAFGNYIDKINAIKIGLLPNVNCEKIEFVGNAAGAGVSMILMSEREKFLVEKYVERIEHIELAKHDSFQDEYMAALTF